MHALKIAEHYPNIIVVSIEDEATGKFSSSVNIYGDDGILGESLYAFEKYEFDSGEEAVAVMYRKVSRYLEGVLTMSN